MKPADATELKALFLLRELFASSFGFQVVNA